MILMNSSQNVSCSFDGTKSASCTITGEITDRGDVVPVSTSGVFSGSEFQFAPVTITSGAEKLAENTAPVTKVGGSAADAAPTSTGGMPAITAAPRWAVVAGGAVVGAALAM